MTNIAVEKSWHTIGTHFKLLPSKMPTTTGCLEPRLDPGEEAVQVRGEIGLQWTGLNKMGKIRQGNSLDDSVLAELHFTRVTGLSWVAPDCLSVDSLAHCSGE